MESCVYFPGINYTTAGQKEPFEARRTARAEKGTIVAESRISRALQSKLPPDTKYLNLPDDLVRVYRESRKDGKDDLQL